MSEYAKTLDYIRRKYRLSFDERTAGPIEIPNMGRNQLPGLFKELNYKTGAEIGVLAGEYSELLCKSIPDLKMYGIDPYRAYIQHPLQEQLDDFFQDAKGRLTAYDYHFIVKPSTKAATDFADRSLDFVYIDGDHKYESVMSDITAWSPKVQPGGIISGHDFLRRRAPTNHYVVQAVTAYIKQHGIRPWFLIGLNAKIPGMIRDRHRSWMWVKQ